MDYIDQRLAEIRNELYSLNKDNDFKEKFDKLQKLIHECAKLKGWWSPSKSFGEQVVMMHSELSEAIDEFRKPNSVISRIYYVEIEEEIQAKPEGVPIELADCTIREMDTAERNEFSLFDAIMIKTTYNTYRPHRHGNKKI